MKYILKEGKSLEPRSAESKPEAQVKTKSDAEKALEIILGLEQAKKQTRQSPAMATASEESEIIKKARAFRREWEEAKHE